MFVMWIIHAIIPCHQNDFRNDRWRCSHRTGCGVCSVQPGCREQLVELGIAASFPAGGVGETPPFRLSPQGQAHTGSFHVGLCSRG